MLWQLKKKIAEEAPLPLRSVHSVRISNISRRESKDHVNDEKKVLCQEHCRCGYGRDSRSEYNCLNSRYGSAEATEAHAEQVLLTLKDSMAAFSRAYALADGCPRDNLIYNGARLGGEAAFRKIMQVRKDTMNGSV